MEKREFCWEQMPVLYVNYFFFLSFSCHQLQLLCINMIMYNNNSSMYVCVSTVCFDKKNLELKQFVCKLYNIWIILNLIGLWVLFTFELVEKFLPDMAFLSVGNQFLWHFWNWDALFMVLLSSKKYQYKQTTAEYKIESN